MLELAERTGADEIMVTSNVVDPRLRAFGLEALADAFGLDPAAPPRDEAPVAAS